MMLSNRFLTASLMLVVCAGCAHRGDVYSSSGQGAWPVGLDGPETERRAFAADVSAVPPVEELLPAQLPDDRGPFVTLNEWDAQQIAASRALMANLLLQESDAVAAQGTKPGVNGQAVEVLRVALQTRAVEERNRSARDALEALLLLAEAEDGLNRIAASLEKTDRLADDLQQLQKQGLPSPLSQEEIEQQRLQLVYQHQETQRSVRQLNQQLAGLLARDDQDLRQIWPDVDLAVNPEPLDPEVEVATAMRSRADLALLNYLRCSVTPETLPAIRQALGQTTAGLGMGLATVGLHVLGDRDTGESRQRSAQLETLLANRERTVAREVRDAVAAVEDCVRRIAISKARLQSQQLHFKNLQQQQAVGAATPLDVRRADLEIVTLEQQLMHDVLQWKIALVRLRAAQGLLAAECGYYPPCGR